MFRLSVCGGEEVTTVHDPVAAVQVLLENHAELPPVAVRAQLRRAAGLTQQQVAEVVGVKPLAVLRWESGAVEPRPGVKRSAYIQLLHGLARRYPGAATTSNGDP
ncbi:helix-turn-helix domain-containing protein [Streptomyces sp. IBSNAI002]|uniref:helix-turn-helix domain-containing protein n=1 Tax=Streptomyces sp. IBSNAI002 TaxID=3457500 RepID=UPI003FCF7437